MMTEASAPPTAATTSARTKVFLLAAIAVVLLALGAGMILSGVISLGRMGRTVAVETAPAAGYLTAWRAGDAEAAWQAAFVEGTNQEEFLRQFRAFNQAHGEVAAAQLLELLYEAEDNVRARVLVQLESGPRFSEFPLRSTETGGLHPVLQAAADGTIAFFPDGLGVAELYERIKTEEGARDVYLSLDPRYRERMTGDGFVRLAEVWKRLWGDADSIEVRDLYVTATSPLTIEGTFAPVGAGEDREALLVFRENARGDGAMRLALIDLP